MITRRPMHKRAFTLIELLTVIAIIAILAAILIPVVGKVREQARGAACQTNLRTIGVAMLLYSEDRNGRLPPFKDPARPDQGLWWLQGLLGQSENGTQHWTNYLDDRWDDVEKRAHYMVCPQSSSVFSDINGIGYGLNLLVSDQGFAPRLDDIRSPTSQVLVADAFIIVSANWYDSALGQHANRGLSPISPTATTRFPGQTARPSEPPSTITPPPKALSAEG